MYLSVEEYAKYKNIPTKNVHNLRRSNKIESKKIDGRIHIHIDISEFKEKDNNKKEESQEYNFLMKEIDLRDKVIESFISINKKETPSSEKSSKNNDDLLKTLNNQILSLMETVNKKDSMIATLVEESRKVSEENRKMLGTVTNRLMVDKDTNSKDYLKKSV